jgi:AraC-like DNA-binding protein
MQEDALLRIKRGYLNEEFKFFHLKDKKAEEHSFHYHEFNKIVIFISGNVTYGVEGKYYKLRPWDILFISSSEVHKPVIDPHEHYERIIIWVNSDFLNSHSLQGSNLSNCFEWVSREKINLFRFHPEHLAGIQETLFSLEKAMGERDFGGKVLQNAIFLQLIVYLNRLILRKRREEEKDVRYDERIIRILAYINENLEGELSVDSLAERFYVNKYYLMHHFKDQTGYTLHSYILQKRLARAAEMIKKGLQISYAADRCGFRDYSSFVRAFKKSFGLSPKQYHKAMEEMRHFYGEDISGKGNNK